jgi:GAF domain-containing protein
MSLLILSGCVDGARATSPCRLTGQMPLWTGRMRNLRQGYGKSSGEVRSDSEPMLPRDISGDGTGGELAVAWMSGHDSRMGSAGEFNRQLAAAVRAMQEQPDTKSTLDRAVITATQIIEGCDLAGISIVHDKWIETVAASDECLKRIDELQYSLGQGPCLDALRDHETVHSPDLSNDERWPEWGPQVTQEIGAGSNVSYRLFTNRHSLGALNLYSLKTHSFSTDDIYNGLALAAHVAVALAASEKEQHLQRAVSNRTVIGQAEGILMERFDIEAEQAFNVLRRVSQDRNVKLNLIAEELVRTRRTPGIESS